MVITVEPGKPYLLQRKQALTFHWPSGIYVPADARFPKHFHNIGIRIEVRYPAYY